MFHRKFLKCFFEGWTHLLMLVMEYLSAFIYILKRKTLSEPSKERFVLVWLMWKKTWGSINEVNFSV